MEEELPDFEPLNAYWVRDLDETQTEWRIENPNPVPLSTNPDAPVRYNWTAYDAFDAQGSVVASDSGLENNSIPNPLITMFFIGLAEVPVGMTCLTCGKLMTIGLTLFISRSSSVYQWSKSKRPHSIGTRYHSQP
jgi:hypothetical protein